VGFLGELLLYGVLGNSHRAWDDGTMLMVERVRTRLDRAGWKGETRMQYLVTEELIDPGPLLPPDQLVGIMRQWVLPSLDALINLKSEGKIIAGGVPVGERALVLIFEAESNEELDSILQRLPLWGLAKWKVTPLENLESRIARDRQFTEQLEQSLQR
jgi:Muconolactone delta-isomerase